MNIAGAILADEGGLPPIQAAGYEYVVAGNGLFIRAEDSRMEAMVPIASARMRLGLANVEPYARLKVDRISSWALWMIGQDAWKEVPKETIYQFTWNGEWKVVMPNQHGWQAGVRFEDDGQSVVDLHSHANLEAFFSNVDDEDELGLRFYAVIGRLDTEWPEIAVRVGVYGHHLRVPAKTVFDGLGPFLERVT